MTSPHPSMAQLELPELEPAVRDHLRGCPQCRIDRRMLLHTPDLPAGEPEPPSTWTDWEAPDLVGTWLSSRVEDRAVARGPLTPPPPGALGRYAIDGLLGRGGMAVVYRVSVIGRPSQRRAIKILTRPDPELRSRLRREGRVQRELDHPNLVRVFEQLEVHGEPALVMEYVEGPTLHQVLREESLPLGLRDGIARDILRGMAAAHAGGVTHRDLKPSNVLLQPTDTGFIAKIADFGIARAEHQQDSIHTRSGAFAGTPLYMAPEQLRDASRADARSDVFSLGALLYELVTGIRCFAGSDYVDIVRRVADGRYRPALEVLPSLPARMARAIEAALRVLPEERPADAAALMALWEEGSEEPVEAWSAARIHAVRGLHRPTWVRVTAAAETPWPPRHNLPDRSGRLVGRASLRSRIVDALGQDRLVSVVGAIGAGRARLAEEAARDVLFTFPGGAWCCDLRDAGSVESQLSRVAEGLGVRVVRDPVEQLRDAIRGRGRTLVLLHGITTELAETVLEDWLDAAPQATFLTTALAPTDLLEEIAFQVDALDEEGAAQLVVDRVAAEVEPDWAVAREVGRELAGSPLAIALAIGPGSSLQAVRMQLRDLALPPASASLPEGVGRAFALRWSQLPESARDLWGQLGWLEPGWTASALAAAVGREVEQDLDRLVEVGLVSACGPGSGGRVRPGLRGVARALGEGPHEVWIRRLEAWRAARHEGEDPLSPVRALLGDPDAPLEALQRGRRAAREVGAVALALRSELAIARILAAAGDGDGAGESLERAIRESRRVGLLDALAMALARLAVVRGVAGSAQRAEALLEEALGLGVPLAPRVRVAVGLCQAELAWILGESDQARAALSGVDAQLSELGLGAGSVEIRERDRIGTLLT